MAVLGCGSTPRDINFGSDAGADYIAPDVVNPSDATDTTTTTTTDADAPADVVTADAATTDPDAANDAATDVTTDVATDVVTDGAADGVAGQ